MIIRFLLCACLLGAHLFSQDAKPDTLIANLGNLNHPVTTSNPEAQKFFNQGLTLIYGFNRDAAYVSFKKATELDPKLAMGYWGMALALGTNINSPITPEKEKQAYIDIQTALKLMNGITDNEKGYIQALAQRYSDSPNPDLKKLELDYKIAMGKFVETYPEDLDAATLYGESAMNLHPWALYTSQGEPIEGTEEIVALLESIIKRDSLHIGANHYYIHAVEASKRPERALLAANRLQKLVLASGHLLHMSSHIYILVGDYHRAAIANERAIVQDKEYVKANGLKGYPLHYMTHNLDFLSRSYSLEGNFKEAKRSSDELAAFYAPNFEHAPDLEYYLATPLLTYLRFQKWDEALNYPEPNPKMTTIHTLWHFAKAVAYAAKGNLPEADKETALFQKENEHLLADTNFGYNKASSIMNVADLVLQARIAEAKHDFPTAISLLQKAVIKQEDLNYNEPPDWYFSVRQSLGAAYFQNGNFEEAALAFKKDLDKHPKDGRSLFGYQKSLEALNRTTDAYWVGEEFKQAWKWADTSLNIKDL